MSGSAYLIEVRTLEAMLEKLSDTEKKKKWLQDGGV